MPSHPIDFQTQADIYSTPELAAVFDEEARFQRWLDFFAALATAQGELGIIPVATAQEISSTAHLAQLDRELIAQGYRTSKNSLIPVLNALKAACRPESADWIHHGATTQDVLDTSQVLELKAAIAIIYRDLRQVTATLIDLVEHHAATPMVGRTHGQQALPITFGHKAAVWLAEMRRHIQRLKRLSPTISIGQLSGAAGTMAALGPQSRLVAAQTMAHLGLTAAPISWHTARDCQAETASLLAIIATSCQKIADEIYQLGRTEIGELTETGGGKSSAMPHKSNPVRCQRITVLARHARALAGIVIESMAHEHERDPRALWSEWLAFPQLAIYTGTAVQYLSAVLTGLTVNTARMRDNLMLHREAILSEWLLSRLAARLGKAKARDLVAAISEQSRKEHTSIKKILASDEQLSSLLSPDELETLDHPERYCGMSETIALEIAAQARDEQAVDPDFL